MADNMYGTISGLEFRDVIYPNHGESSGQEHVK